MLSISVKEVFRRDQRFSANHPKIAKRYRDGALILETLVIYVNDIGGDELCWMEILVW
jgi:hypothetical protein